MAVVAMALCFMTTAVLAQSGRTRPTPTPTPKDDEVKIKTEEVKLNVVAFDEAGKFVGDVTKDDLVITENDILHQPTSVRRIPANILIVLDTGGEMRAVKTLDQTKRTAKALIDSLGSGDQIAVLEYSDKADIIGEWTTDKSIAKQNVDRAKFGRHSAFVAALDLARKFFARSGVDNKHLVLISDGTDSDRRSSGRFDAFQAILGTDISVHVLSYTTLELMDIEPRAKGISKTPPPPAMPPEIAAQLPNGVRDTAQAPKIGPTINVDRKQLKVLRQRKADLEDAEEQLGKLTENTNGVLMLPGSLEEMISRAPLVARMIDSSYVVTYTPKTSFGDNGGERNITVTSKRAGLIIQGRRKLVVASDDDR